MADVTTPPRNGRENRLLFITIAVSVAMLLVLSRYRFPEEDLPQPTAPPAAPLERLAARATFSELATIISGLQDRVMPGVVVIRIVSKSDQNPRYVPAIRLGGELALAALPAGARVTSVVGAKDFVPEVTAADPVREIALVRVPARADLPPLPWSQAPSVTEPAYVAVIEGTRAGPAVRPVFLGRTDPVSDPRWERPLLVLGGLQQATPGSLLMSLDGAFLGITALDEGFLGIIQAPQLAADANRLTGSGGTPGSEAGITVQTLTTALARATGATEGAIVTYVDPLGPAARVLEVGDVIEAVGDYVVASAEDVNVRILGTPAGTALGLAVMRRGERTTVEVTTSQAGGAVPVDEAAGLGLVLRDVRGVGLEVMDVVAGSAGALAGVKPGDVITHVDGQPTPTTAKLTRGFRTAKRAILLGVRRQQQRLVVALERP
jgi:serine protease Do